MLYSFISASLASLKLRSTLARLLLYSSEIRRSSSDFRLAKLIMLLRRV